MAVLDETLSEADRERARMWGNIIAPAWEMKTRGEMRFDDDRFQELFTELVPDSMLKRRLSRKARHDILDDVLKEGIKRGIVREPESQIDRITLQGSMPWVKSANNQSQ